MAEPEEYVKAFAKLFKPKEKTGKTKKKD